MKIELFRISFASCPNSVWQSGVCRRSILNCFCFASISSLEFVADRLFDCLTETYREYFTKPHCNSFTVSLIDIQTFFLRNGTLEWLQICRRRRHFENPGWAQVSLLCFLSYFSRVVLLNMAPKLRRNLRKIIWPTSQGRGPLLRLSWVSTHWPFLRLQKPRLIPNLP